MLQASWQGALVILLIHIIGTLYITDMIYTQIFIWVSARRLYFLPLMIVINSFGTGVVLAVLLLLQGWTQLELLEESP